MAVFGLPGGAEWLVIATTAVLLFVPSLGLVALGYLLGRRSAMGDAPPAASGGAEKTRSGQADAPEETDD